MRAYLEQVLRTAVTAAAVALCLMSPARAAFYSGAWDPTFGQPFVGSGSPIGFGLGWRGTVEVFVPDECAFGSGARDFGASSTCAQNSSVQSASVELYDVLDPAEATKGTVTFTTSSMSILALHFVDDNLISLTTLPSSWDQAAWISPPPPASPFFSLLFVDSATSNCLRAPLQCIGIPLGLDLLGLSDEIPADYFGPLLLTHPNFDFDDPVQNLGDLFAFLRALGNISVSDVESNPPTYPNGSLFALAAPPTDIPEPGSLALIAVALFATAWAARTRRRV